MTRAKKDRIMAERIVEACKLLPRGKVAGVAGNDLRHSERLCELVREIAQAKGVDISHVTLKPIATEHITKEAVDRLTGRTH